MTTTVGAHSAQERWFLDRGLPSVLTQRARLRALWPRSAPLLPCSATLDACSAATYQLTGRHEYFIGAPIAVQRIGVLAATQLARILTVAFVTWALFFIMGLVLMTPELMDAWTQHNPTYGMLLGYPIPVPQALIRMTLFLGALTFMYVSARAAGNGEYRDQFLDPLIDDLELTLLARNRYLGYLDTDRPATPGSSRRVA